MRIVEMRRGLAALVAAALGVALLSTARPAVAEEEEDEEEVAIADLPEAVVDAIQERFPEGTMEEAERETEDGQVVYEVEVEDADGTEYEVEVTEDGKILEVERDSEDADDDDDDDADDDEEEDDDDDDDDDNDHCDDDDDDD